jgi:hypothetical protein
MVTRTEARERWMAVSAAGPVAVLLATMAAVTVHSFVTRDGWFHGRTPVSSGSALIDAVIDGDLATVDALLIVGQSPDVRVPYRHHEITRGRVERVSPLFVAVARGDENVARLLLEVADLSRPENAETFCAALSFGRADMVRALLDRAADPAAVDTCPASGGRTLAELVELAAARDQEGGCSGRCAESIRVKMPAR